MAAEWFIALVSLIVLEVILGIDNIIFISILADKLPEHQRAKLRNTGIGLAVIIRLILLGFISWILKLDKTLIQLLGKEISGKEIILIIGGIFLLYKATKEIYHKTETVHNNEKNNGNNPVSFNQLLIQVLLLDLVFSVDSIITAVGMVDELWIMYTAVLVSVAIMLIAAKSIHGFISAHPSFKILALCFLMMIGVALIGEGLEFHIPKAYIYCSMAFAFIVDLIQMKTVKTK